MLQNDSSEALVHADDFVASSRRGLLIETVAASVADVLNARSTTSVLPEVLARVARVVHIDRLVVVESVNGPGDQRFSVFFSWTAAATVPPATIAEVVRTAGGQPALHEWLEPLAQGRPIMTVRCTAGTTVRKHLQATGVLTSLMVPVMVEGRYWGRIGLEDCTSEHDWDPDDIRILTMLAETIGAAITRDLFLAQARQREQEIAKANTIIQSSPTVLYRLSGDAALSMAYISQNIAQLGHNPADLLADARRYRELFHPDDRAGLQAAMQTLLQPDAKPGAIEVRMLSKSGGVRWFENRYRPVHDENGRLAEIEGVLSDITERKQAEERIALLARTDALTGAANRLIFGDRLRQAFAAAQRGAHPFAVLYLDLDRFKEVNDTLGHHAGDLLLQQVAARLKATTRKIDVVARLGGDEFAIIQAEVSDSSAAGRLAGKLIEIVAAPYTIDGNELRIGTSIGIALWERETPNPDSLLAQADQALYRAKHAGRGQYRFFSEEIDHETREHLALAEDLRAALGRGEIELYYQPQVELVSGRIMGMETLLRWHHPRRGLLLPEDFLPIAEKFGIMQQLGRWTLDGACRQMSLWRQQHLSVPLVAVNVALAQIKMATEFVRDVTECLERWRLQPSDLELDVTEHVLARTTLSQSDVLVELRRLGVGIAIDNFGAKYSTLDYLRTYRVNRLKIARGMVAAAEGLAGGSAMIRAILSLAAELGLDVVAEGVETANQRDLLVSASARAQGQGFFYSHPVSASESMQMLRAGVVLPEGNSPAD